MVFFPEQISKNYKSYFKPLKLGNFHLLFQYVSWLWIILLGIDSSLYANPYESMIDQVVRKYSKEYLRPFDYVCEGYGGAMHGDVRQVFVYYLKQGDTSINQARKVYIDSMEELLKRINATSCLRPYLHNYPFQRENIRLGLSWRPEKNKQWANNELTFMFLSEENQFYYFSHSNDQKLYVIHSEPYEEALAIVRKEREAALGKPVTANQ